MHLSMWAHTQNTISLVVKKEQLKNVFELIERQSEYRFLYNDNPVFENKKITLKIQEAPVDKIMDQLLEGTGLQYKITANNLITLFFPVADGKSGRPFKIIKGTVKDEKGLPLARVTITVKGTSKGTATDSKGTYTIEANAGDVLEFSNIGYKKVSLTVGEDETINVSMELEMAGLNEIVVIGYGTQRKASLTSAVTTVNTREMTNIPASNLSNLLAGRASGVFVQSPTGIPGKTSSVRIRSASSWNAAPPLFVIDGIVRDQSAFDALDPSQIDNLTILKDAASTAIYGSRASNGVLLVTTKTGKKGKPQVQLSSVLGVHSKPAINFKYMPLLQAADIVNNLYAPDVKYNDFDRQWIAKNNPEGKIYYNEVYQDPFSQKHAINISGGNEDVSYFIGGNYYNEKGFLPQLRYERYNFRGNVVTHLNKDLSVGLNVNVNNGNRRTFWSGLANDEDLSGFYEKLFYLGGGSTPAYVDGKPVNPKWLGGNPIEVMRNGGYSKYNDQQIDALLTAEYKVPFIKGLGLKFIYSQNFNNRFSKKFAKKTTLYDFKADPASKAGVLTNEVTGTVESGLPTTPFVENTNGKTRSYQLNGMITYDKKIAQHSINVLAAYEQAEGYYTYSSINRQNFPFYTADQFPFTSSASADTKATGYEFNMPARISYIGRINYDFAGKYLASVSVREDGSSNFAPAQRWGFFPSASAAWVISNESFFGNLNKKGLVDVMKLRMSVGTTGNDPSFNWLWKELYNASVTSYAVGDPVVNSSILAYNGISNPGYTWETSKAFNAGLDLSFLKHWNITAELWEKKTFDILGKRVLTLPIEFGANFPPENYGKMNAKGLEVELSYVKAKLGKDLEMNVSANVGLATTKVVQIDAPANSLAAENPNGKPLNAMAGYHATGIIRTQNDLNALPGGYTIFGATPELGMMNFEDVSGPDAKPDGKIDNYDKVVLAKYGNTGNTAASYNNDASFASNNAPVSFGLNFNFKYKGLSLDMLWGGLAGYKILYNDPWGRSFPGLVAPTYYEDAWTTDNPGGKAPKIFRSGDPRENGYKVPSTYNIYNGAFVRLKNLQVSYDLGRVLKNGGIKAATVFVNGTNLLIIRGFKYYDPETFSSSSYPVMRNVNMGVNFQF
ncbi:SusC/RagA family TonB-linked outer membrane protein [Niastella vici]|nr:SusC/RagA family TonB-linked outer membrane protein [Niastella vici]